jgi:hypothetical protein
VSEECDGASERREQLNFGIPQGARLANHVAIEAVVFQPKWHIG